MAETRHPRKAEGRRSRTLANPTTPQPPHGGIILEGEDPRDPEEESASPSMNLLDHGVRQPVKWKYEDPSPHLRVMTSMGNVEDKNENDKLIKGKKV